jgi:SpoVK/Ycf46/Vps4 family AAA+-type ATPase
MPLDRRDGRMMPETFGDVLLPEEAEEPILAKPVRAALLEWLTEIWATDELAAVGLKARRRAIFHGAPGTGKTTLAHHLAARLGLPMLVVRPERIKSKWIGQTAMQVGALFEALKAQEEPFFLFFDEFDSLAAQRMDSGQNQVGEQDHNHGVNALLANFDRYEGFIVAATNHGRRVDEAIWRRFEIQIELALPGDHERRRIIERYFAPFVLPPKVLESLSLSLETASPALMRAFAEHIKRQIVVGPKAGWAMDREAVLARVLETVKPHPDLGLPALWSRGLTDRAALAFPWPLARDLDAYAEGKTAPVPAETASVVPLKRSGR